MVTKTGNGGEEGADVPALEEHKLIAERRAKLAELRRRGGGAATGSAATGSAVGSGASGAGADVSGLIVFPNDFRRDALAGQLHASFGERTAE